MRDGDKKQKAALHRWSEMLSKEEYYTCMALYVTQQLTLERSMTVSVMCLR
jgi:hypothetical protein